MDDLISRSKAIRWVKAECNPYGQPTLDYESGIKVIEHLERMPSAQPDSRLTEIADLVEGAIAHFNLDDAMDLPYQINEVLKNG